MDQLLVRYTINQNLSTRALSFIQAEVRCFEYDMCCLTNHPHLIPHRQLSISASNSRGSDSILARYQIIFIYIYLFSIRLISFLPNPCRRLSLAKSIRFYDQYDFPITFHLASYFLSGLFHRGTATPDRLLTHFTVPLSASESGPLCRRQYS